MNLQLIQDHLWCGCASADSMLAWLILFVASARSRIPVARHVWHSCCCCCSTHLTHLTHLTPPHRHQTPQQTFLPREGGPLCNVLDWWRIDSPTPNLLPVHVFLQLLLIFKIFSWLESNSLEARNQKNLIVGSMRTNEWMGECSWVMWFNGWLPSDDPNEKKVNYHMML